MVLSDKYGWYFSPTTLQQTLGRLPNLSGTPRKKLMGGFRWVPVVALTRLWVNALPFSRYKSTGFIRLTLLPL